MQKISIKSKSISINANNNDSSLFQSTNATSTTNQFTEQKYTIYNFLEEHRADKGGIYTHTSMDNPKGTFYIPNQDLDTFYSLYEKAIFDNNRLHLIERHSQVGPVIIDLDFRYNINIENRLHNFDHIKTIISLYNNEICDLFEIEKDDPRMVSFVFERKAPYKSIGYTKDGIHIMYPFIISSPTEQYYIRENILKKIGKVFEDLPLENSIADIVDRAVIEKNGWFMFGSTKPKCEPYNLSYIIDGNADLININDYQFYTKDYPKFFSIRNKKEVDCLIIRNEKKECIIKTSTKNINMMKKKTHKKILNDDDIKRISSLVEILKEDRAENFTNWITIGWILHNIDPESNELLDIWIQFSQKSKKFKEGECEKLWIKMRNEGYSEGTLRHFARADNLDKYNEIISEDINKYVEISLSQTNYDVAKVLHAMYKYNFVYSNNTWYMFRNHRWEEVNDAIYLRQKISTELCDKYRNIIIKYNKIISTTEIEEEEKEKLVKKLKELQEITRKLKTTSFKDNIIKECKELFINKHFINKLDDNPYLIGFENGVYDLKNMEFRDGIPDDYISLSTGINKIDFDKTNEYWEDLQNFVNTIFPGKDIRDYFLKFLSTCLQGVNAEEKFRIWTGQGCHAFDTQILMHDGTNKLVQDIRVGDKLMGDDGRERNVLNLKKGRAPLYNIIYNDSEFMVNGDHILCLKFQDNGDSADYFNVFKDKNLNVIQWITKSNMVNSIRFRKKINLDKWIDKLMNDPDVCKGDDVIEISVTDYINNGFIEFNKLRLYINNLGYNNTKAIEIITELNENNRILSRDEQKILNMNGYIYSEDLFDSKTYLLNKEPEKVLYYDFIVQEADEDYYYGFEIDGNNRYIMGNLIVTHNSNGKSKIEELFVNAFGEYTIKFPITLLTGKRAQSNSATPEIAQSKGKRFGYFEEPSQNEKINAGLLKEFTGGDKLKARALHKEPIEFKPQFKLVLLCNDLPEVPPNDSGTWRRMEVIEFKSRFCENPKEENEFPIDKYLSDKLKNWNELFMALLIDVYYCDYKKNGLFVPDEIIKYTKEYQKTCDMFIDFFHEYVEETNDKNDCVDINHLYELFKTWYTNYMNTNKVINKGEFKKNITKRYGKLKIINSKDLLCCKIKKVDEEEESI
jgi:P4 family phage/plasmid primase-like protien